MEKADKVTGGVKSLTDDQKKRIAEIRSIAEAQIAEDTIMLDNKLKNLAASEMAHAEADLLKQELLRDKEKIAQKAEAKIEKIRNET